MLDDALVFYSHRRNKQIYILSYEGIVRKEEKEEKRGRKRGKREEKTRKKRRGPGGRGELSPSLSCSNLLPRYPSRPALNLLLVIINVKTCFW